MNCALRCRSIRSAFLVLSAVLLFSSAADARLEGDATLTYTSYEGSADARKVDGSTVRNPDGSIARNRMTSSSFVQNYSLMYSSSGPIYNSRVGVYDVALGYNWTGLDTTFKSWAPLTQTSEIQDYNETRGHLLYKGEITIDPKEVPFRLNAYSRDLNNNSVVSSTGHNMDNNFSSIFGSRELATSINDGLHITTGATLVAGVKNGMTNGYNEVLRHFPMILIDYKNVTNRDLRAVNRVDDQLSRLAFVSLNKKDNWFHYRHTLYEDKLNSQNNYVENEIQLGTVDQYMARRWIDFTNWIKVSTDLQLSRRKSNYMINASEEINLNMFVTAERSSWNARSFGTFNRFKNENELITYQTTLPVYVTGTVSQDLSWNARTSFKTNRDVDRFGNSTLFNDELFGYRVDAFKRSAFTLSQSFEVESSQRAGSDFLSLGGSIDTTSTARFSREVSLAASYNVKNYTISTAGVASSNFIDQTIMLHGGYAFNNTLRMDISQKNTLTRGNLATFEGPTQLTQYVAPRILSSAEIGSNSYNSVSSLTVTWNPKPRLTGYFAVSEDIFRSAGSGVSMLTDVSSSLSYSTDGWGITDTVRYAHGGRESGENNADTVTDTFAVKYTHSRNLDVSGLASYTLNSGKNGQSYESSFEQKLNYNYFTRSGVARKILEFNETLMYSDGSNPSGAVYNKSLALGLKYYPISKLTLSTGVGYSYSNTINDYTIVWNAAAAANFRLLQASIDYIHGVRKADGARENRITGTVRKAF